MWEGRSAPFARGEAGAAPHALPATPGGEGLAQCLLRRQGREEGGGVREGMVCGRFPGAARSLAVGGAGRADPWQPPHAAPQRKSVGRDARGGAWGDVQERRGLKPCERGGEDRFPGNHRLAAPHRVAGEESGGSQQGGEERQEHRAWSRATNRGGTGGRDHLPDKWRTRPGSLSDTLEQCQCQSMSCCCFKTFMKIVS